MAENIVANGTYLLIKNKDLVYKHGQMDLNMSDFGNKIKQMDMVD